MDIDANGNLLIQEDPGGNPHRARIVAYRIADGARGVLAEFDPLAVHPRGAEVPHPGRGVQRHHRRKGDPRLWLVHLRRAGPHAERQPGPFAAEEVEEGQLLAMKVEDFGDIYDD